MSERGYGLKDFRFSGSYASRYMNCHGSAVLEEALPGFKAKPANNLLTTPAGKVKSHVLGTAVHTIFEGILENVENILEAAVLLDELAAKRGNARTELITDEKAYITWWFLANNALPPIEFNLITRLFVVVEEQKYWDDLEDIEVVIPKTTESIPPKLIRFMADALRFIYTLIDGKEGGRVYLEKTVKADWTATKPGTTADIVITDGKTLDIVDLKIGTIAVAAFENDQLLYYGKTYRTTETALNVHILQAEHPGGVDTWEVTDEYLDGWTEKALEAEQAILNGSRNLLPGKHCLFCPANPYSKGEKGSPVCPAQMEALFGPADLSIITEEDD